MGPILCVSVPSSSPLLRCGIVVLVSDVLSSFGFMDLRFKHGGVMKRMEPCSKETQKRLKDVIFAWVCDYYLGKLLFLTFNLFLCSECFIIFLLFKVEKPFSGFVPD